jgi:hypothetical protein
MTRTKKRPGGHRGAQRELAVRSRNTGTNTDICNCNHRRGECCQACCPGAMAGKVAVELTSILDLLRTGRTSDGIALLDDLRDELAESFFASHPGAGEAA